MKIDSVYEKLTINAKISLSLAIYFSSFEIGVNVLTFLRRGDSAIAVSPPEQYFSTGKESKVGVLELFLGCLANLDSLGSRLVAQSDYDLTGLLAQLPTPPVVSDMSVFKDELPSDPGIYSKEVQLIIQRAYQLANRLSHLYVGTEHIILAILSMEESKVVKILKKVGIDYKSYFDTLMGVANYSAISKSIGQMGSTEASEAFSTEVGIDLVHLAKLKKLDPVIGRENEIDQLVNIVSRRRKNNAIVVGQAGVGKTALIEGFAQRIADGNVPSSLAQFRIISVDITAIIAGSKMRGDVEEKMAQIIDFVIKNPKTILFIDEMQSVITSSSPVTGSDITAVLKPALLHPDFRCLGTTTSEDWSRYFEEDKALSRRFQPLLIEEPTVQESIEILGSIRPVLEKHHEMKIEEDALRDAVILSDRFVSDRYLPDKAIDLLDEATATSRLEIENKYGEVISLEKKLGDLERRKRRAVLKDDMELASRLKSEEEETRTMIAAVRKKMKSARTSESNSVDSESVQKIVSKWTGIPVGTISQEESNTVLNLSNSLSKKIVGQKDAVNAVANAVKRARANVSSISRPWASLLFLGPTGVGKTELAKEVARELFGDEKRLVQIDMSELMEAHSVSKLIGSPPGYVGYKEGGQLTEAVSRHPHSVVLFDEIEKAHATVLNILLQILEEGHLTDARGKRVNFKNTIIILTSNIGVEEIQSDKILGFADKKRSGSKTDKEISDAYENMKTELLGELKEYLRPELFNRLDDVVIFRMLQRSDARKIVRKLIDELNERLLEQAVQVEIDRKGVNYIVKKGFSEEYGARMLRRVLQDEVESLIADWVLRNGRKLLGARQDDAVKKLHISRGDDELKLEVKG